MGGKAYFLYREVDSDWFVALHTGNAITFFEVTGNAALCTVASNTDTIFGIVTPSLQESA